MSKSVLGLSFQKRFPLYFLLGFVSLSFCQIANAQSLDRSCKNCSRKQLDSIHVNHPRNIRLNQAGYRSEDPHKWAWVADPSSGTDLSFILLDEKNGSEVFQGDLVYIAEDSSGGHRTEGYLDAVTPDYKFERAGRSETLYRAAFGGLAEEGTYRIVAGDDTSAAFVIASDLYNHVLETGLKFFGCNRCGATHSWFHEDCHLQDGSALGASFAGRLSGGWHDCGDHGKYSETLAYTALMLSLTYTIWPEKAADKYGESYNDQTPDGIPDILFEAKVGVDYIYKLFQVSEETGLIAGNDMYHSVGTGPGQDHQYWHLPEHQESLGSSQGGAPRPVTAGIGSNVAGSYAASLALFAGGYQSFDPDYASQLVRAATVIYDSLVMAQRGTSTTMPCCYPGIGHTHDDEAMAALALWFATGEERFRYDLLDNTDLNDNPTARFNQGEFPAGHLGRVPFHHGGWTTDYSETSALVLFGLAKLILPDAATAANYGVDSEVRDSLLADITQNLRQSISLGSNGSNSTSYPGIHVDQPYHGVFTSIEWGYNRYNLGMVTELFMAWDLTGEDPYYEVGMDNLNYLFGANPWDVSFMVGAGDRFLNHVHNRAANPEGNNQNALPPYEYRHPIGAVMGGARPNLPLVDEWSDYVNSETCIDFSAQMLIPAQMLAASSDTTVAIRKPTHSIKNLSTNHATQIVVFDLRGRKLGRFTLKKGEAPGKFIKHLFSPTFAKWDANLYILQVRSGNKILSTQKVISP